VTLPAIEIHALRKQYGAVTALHGVDLTIPRGSLYALLGPNGAGKSTVINIMAGVVNKTAGRVRVLGHDTVSEYRAARRLLGVVPQEIAFDPFFTVEESLRIHAGYFGVRDPGPQIDFLLDALALADKRRANTRQLSGGMKRRLLIAKALVHRPKVLVLDEPTAGVDVELRQQLWALVRQLHAEGTTVLLTTHYLEEAESLCERIAILDHGRLVADHATAELLDRVSHKQIYVQLAEDLAAIPPALAPFAPVWDRARGRLRLTVSRHEPVAAALAIIQHQLPEIRDIQTVEPRLEDVFRQLTNSHGASPISHPPAR
jgi:ABC-2 type transport system ATP-binding protein